MSLDRPEQYHVSPDLDHPWSMAYLDQLRAERRSVLAPGKAARAFCRWYQQPSGAEAPSTVDLTTVTSGHMQQFIRDQLGVCAYETVRTSYCRIRAWFRYMYCQEWLEIDPTCTVKGLKKRPVRVDWRILTNDEYGAILRAVAQHSLAPVRDLALFGLLGGLGLRPSEATLMTIDDVDLNKGSARVYGKGMKEREVPLEGAVRDGLYRYLEHRKPQDDSGALWLNTKGQPLRYRSLLDTFHNYLDLAGINKAVGGPHVFRHYFVTQCLLAGMDLEDVAALVGHSSPRELEPYFHLSDELLMREIDRVYQDDPLARRMLDFVREVG